MDFFKSNYKQYKEDTDAVATWLARTAKKCGYAVDLLVKKPSDEALEQSKEPPAKSGRLKGKARKAAREMAQAESRTAVSPANDTSAIQSKPTYTIALKDFTTLAEWIAGFESPPIKVPQSFVITLVRAISLRRKHSDFTPAKDEESDERHKYFVGILMHVRDVLRPRMSPDSSEAISATAEGKKTAANKFEGLEVQEPSDEFLQAPDLVPRPPSPPLEPNYEAERLQDMEETLFAFNLLIEDYGKLRALISKAWIGYQQGMFDIITASLTTNTVLDIARRMEEDVQPLIQNFGGLAKILNAYYGALCLQAGVDPQHKERPGDDMNFKVWKESQTFYYQTYRFLEVFVPMVDRRHIPEYKPGYYGVYDPTSDRSKKSARDKNQEDKAVMAQMLTEFGYICIGLEKFPAEDEILRCLREAFRTKQVRLSLAFGLQMVLDIHNILRDDVGRGFEDLRRISELMNHSIGLTLKFHKSLRIENWPRSNDKLFQQIQSQIDYWVNQDPIAQARSSVRRPPGTPHRFMQQHPLFCGLLAYSLRISYLELGVAFANSWGSLLYTYHLYNAVRQEKLLGKQWEDLEVIFGLQGNIFVGDRPKSMEECLKQFTLSMGYSATAFAKNRRKNMPLEASKKGPRGLEELAPVMHMFKNRYYVGSGQTELTLQDIEVIISKSRWDTEEVENGLFELSFNSTKQPSKKSVGTASHLDAVGLLTRLQYALQAEIVELGYDYLWMHRSCWRFLSDLHHALDSDLREIYGPGYLEKESQLPFLVGYIIMAATNTKTLGNHFVPKKTDVVTSRLLTGAAAFLDSITGSEYSDIVCRLLERAHNVAIAPESDGDGDDDDDDDDNRHNIIKKDEETSSNYAEFSW